MGYNKLAGYRYRLIDHCLRNRHRKWTMDALQEYISQKLEEEFDRESGVSRRQLQYDFALMRKDPPEGYGAPIVRKDGYVYYSDPEFSIAQVPLNNQDLQALRAALHLLRPFDELPYFDELQVMLRKLEGSGAGKGLGEQEPVVLFEKNERLRGRHWLARLFDVVLEKKPLSVRYHPFNFEEPVEFYFHPYLLKEFNSRWYVLGWNEVERAVWILALDRILEMKVLKNHPFRPNRDLDTRLYFQDIIGVTIPKDLKKEVVRLLVSQARAPYLITKPIHPSQREVGVHPDGRMELEVEVIPNQELDSLLLSFGSDLEVLGPPSIRERIGKALRDAVLRYGEKRI